VNPILARTAANIRAIRVARRRGRRYGETHDFTLLAFCRSFEWQSALDRRARLVTGRIAKGGIN